MARDSLRDRSDTPSELTFEQVARLEEEFYGQAQSEFGDQVTPFEGGLQHFRKDALLPQGEISLGSVEEVRDIAKGLILNYDEESIRANFANTPRRRDALLRQGPVNEHFLQYGDVLRDQHKTGHTVVLGGHPTVATPAYHEMGMIDVFGEQSRKLHNIVIGPFPASMEIYGINPLQLLNILGNVYMTAPSGKFRRGEHAEAMQFLAQNFVTQFTDRITSTPEEGEEYEFFYVMSGGTRDKKTQPLKPHKRAVQAAGSTATKMLIQPGTNYVVVGTDDHLFDPEFSETEDIRSAVHRKLRIFRIEENPDARRALRPDKPFLLFDAENETSEPSEMSATEAMRFFERLSVRLANSAAVDAGSRSKYYYTRIP